MSSEALTGFCDSLVFLHKSTLTENLVRVSLGEERAKNSVIYIFVLLSLFFYPLVALPHLRFTFSAIHTKWEGDFQPDVALPLIVQPAKDSISEVGVRLIDQYPKTSQPRNPKRGTSQRQSRIFPHPACFTGSITPPNPTAPNSMPILNSTVTSSVSNGMAISLS